MRLASSSPRLTARASRVADMSMVEVSAPRWKLTVGALHACTNAADNTCWPVCCWMWSRRRAASISPATTWPDSSGERARARSSRLPRDRRHRGSARRQASQGRAAGRRKSDRTPSGRDGERAAVGQRARLGHGAARTTSGGCLRSTGDVMRLSGSGTPASANPFARKDAAVAAAARAPSGSGS